ncbi:hypothetical protein LTR86_010645 [Recurvomyces mirabilis]|nr:hypothetical protein LTR86_010645 [Recurvomyces mirabilis]
MSVDLLAIWEATKTKLDDYGGQIKQLMKDEACAAGELEAVDERRQAIAAGLAVLKQKRADLEAAMQGEASRICDSFTTQLPEMKREEPAPAPGVDASAVHVPEVATVQAAGAQSNDDHQGTIPVDVVPAKDGLNVPQHRSDDAQHGSNAPQHRTNALGYTGIGPQHALSPLPEDDDDADFAAMDELTATKPQSTKRERSESPGLEDTITAKPRKLQTTERATQPGPSKTKSSEGIHPDFPTIVQKKSGQWVELRCHLCGSNRSSQLKTLYKGGWGMTNHYVHSHKDQLGEGERYRTVDVIEMASYHILSKEEVEGILARDPGAYVVPTVAAVKRSPPTKVDGQ